MDTPPARTSWSLGPTDGELTIRTGVAGRAARMGHRLILVLDSWAATVDWNDEEPSSVHLTVEVDSLRVDSGDGGVTPLTGAEKAVARSNALKALDSASFPTIDFQSDSITEQDGGFRLTGPVTIHGVSKPADVTLTVDRSGTEWRIDGSAVVDQTAFGVKPFSMMMGSVKVADDVTVALNASGPVTGSTAPPSGRRSSP